LAIPQASTVLWWRWAIFLVYPLLLYSAHGFSKVMGHRARRRVTTLALRTSFTALLMVTTVLSGYYLASPPEQAHRYFGEWNHYLVYIQSSMLQNSLPLKDTRYAVEAIGWLNANMNDTSVLVAHEAFYNWAALYLNHGGGIAFVGEKNLSRPQREDTAEALVAAARQAQARGRAAYTIWWVSGKGWYNMPSLPQGFEEIRSFGDIAVYAYQG